MLVILQSVIYFVKSGREENVSVAENDISGNVTAESVSVGKETSDNAVRAHAGSESRDYRKTDRGVERGKQYELFEFDPNTADSASFVMLGFSPKQAASILKYRRKGGIFRKREDFSKLYVVSDEKYRELEKYISIKSVAYSAGGMEGLLDLNAADSAALDALPGIGGYYSRKILEYRSRLGAFSDSKQLLEIYGFGKERYDGLEQYVYAGKVPKIRMTEADSAFLACHPYIGEYGCAAILEYVRFRRGREGNIFISFAELIENEIIKTDKLDYLRFVFE